MAIDFPSSPTNGQVYTYGRKSWTYDSANGVWNATKNPTTTAATQTRNFILNGAFDVWQRGTSISVPSSGGLYTETYCADRWFLLVNGTGGTKTLSRQTFATSEAPDSDFEGGGYLRYACTVAPTGETYNAIGFRFADSRTFAGQQITVSFWAKSSTSSTLSTSFGKTHGTNGSAQESGLNTTSFGSLTSTWTKYTTTVTISSVSGKIINDANSWVIFQFNMPLNATATVDIWGVQIELGATATPFIRAHKTVEKEEEECLQYYRRYTSASAANAVLTNYAAAQSTTAVYINIPQNIRMWKMPSAVETSAGIKLFDGVNYVAPGTIALSGSTAARDSRSVSCTTTGLTQFRMYALAAQASTTEYVAFVANVE